MAICLYNGRMREYVIQRGWENYAEDFGLSRILLFVTCYNVFLLFIAIVFFHTFDIFLLLPILLSILFFSLRSSIILLKPRHIFLVCFLPTLISIGFNYFLIGRLDRIAGGLERLDQYFIQFELFLFGGLLGELIENFLTNLGTLGTIQLDLMMFSYLSFYLLPYLGSIRFFTRLKHKRKFVIGRFFASLIIFHSLNYIFYLLIPITGPQHFLTKHYPAPIQFGPIAEALHSIIHTAQTNYIDCFPSGHFGASLIVAIWMVRINDKFKYPMLILLLLIALATLTLRYHYLADLIGAIPLAILAYFLAFQLIPTNLSGENASNFI